MPITKSDDEPTSFTLVGNSTDSREEPPRSCAPKLFSRGLSRPLVHLVPHVHKPPLGCGGHLLALEDCRRGIKGQLELEAPSVDGHWDALCLRREVIDNILAPDLIVEDAE